MRSVRMNERINECMNDKMDESLNEWMCQLILNMWIDIKAWIT